MMRIRRPGAQRGSTLLPITFVMVTVVGLSMGMMEHGLAEKTSLRHDETSAAALELAEIGLAKAEMELRGRLDLDGNGIGIVEGSVPGGHGRDAMQYEVAYERSATDPSVYMLQGIGQSNLSVRRVVVDLKVTQGHRFQHAMLGARELEMRNAAMTTSYDSRDADLPPAEQSMARLGRAAFESGHVASNDDIELASGVTVLGDARCGPGKQLTMGRSGGDDDDDDDDGGRRARVTGSTAPMAERIELPLPPEKDFEHALANHDNDGISWTADVSYSRNRLRLTAGGHAIVVFPGGTYFFNELTVRDGAKVVFQGPSKIYVTGKLVLESSAGFNLPGRPSDVEVIAHAYDVHGSHRDPRGAIEFDEGMRAALTLYAPGRDVQVKRDAVVYGAIVGRKVTAQNRAEIHFDLALLESDPTGGDVERLAWREAK